MEYELHKQLVNKLKVKGMNSLFGLKIQFTIGEMQIVAIAVRPTHLTIPPLIAPHNYLLPGASTTLKLMMHIAFSPNFHKIYKFPPYFRKIYKFPPYFSSI